MTIIMIAVSINDKGVVTYTSTSPQVASDGTITIEVGEDASITFAPAAGQNWVFADPWISIVSKTPGIADVTVTSVSAEAITIADANPANTKASTYSYTLTTSNQTLDPAILNKGR